MGWVAVDQETGTVYTAGEAANTVLVINGRTNKVTATIPVGNEPFVVAVNDATDTVYAANHADNTISVINGRANKVTATIPVSTSRSW